MANISNYSNKGTSRDERFIPALDDEYFKIDDRTLNDFASFAVKYGTLINYYNEDNKLDGDWSSFFKDDESFILININAFKYKKHQRSFNYLLSEIQTTSNKVEITNIYKVIFNKLFEVFVLIEKWYQLTSLIKEFHRELRNLIKKRFSLVLSKMIVFQDDILKSGIVESIDLFDVSKLSSVWEINTFAHDNHEFLGKSYSEKSNDSAKQFESYIANYIDILRIVIKSSGEYLEKQLFKSGNVKPHIGLFIAFIKLYKFAQDDLNKFLGRHLEYYFKEILKFSYRKEIPDQVYVFLTPTSNLKTVLLPKGTQLIAGADPDGNQLIYSLIADFSLNHASIQKILGVINETSKPVFDLALNKIGLNQKYIIDNSLCLENQESIKKIQENDSLGVKMGFAISSSILLLSEGLRRVNLNFEFSKQSFNDFIGCMTEYISKNYNSNVKITDLILNPFAISYSTEDDNWFEIPDEDIEIQIIKHEDDFLNRIEFKLFIGTTYPPVLPHIESDFIDSNKLKLPVFRFHYKHDNNSFYNFYKLLSIETIDIEVDVLGVKNLIVQNDYGPLDVSSPFDPFGPIPSIGSSFYIGHENIFNHNLNELRIQFDWFNIPPNDLGFYEYYQGYDGVENNDVFKAKISILDNYRWFPDENQQIISLFESVEDVDIDVDPVNNYRLINNIDTIRLSIAKTTKCNTDTIYSKSTRNGFIKLELCYPPIAFGHKVYPDLFKRNLTASMKKKGELANLNEPYTPNIKEIQIDYSARIKINLKDLSEKDNNLFYQIFPFGQSLQNGRKFPEMHFYPDFQAGTELIFGIENLYLPQTFGIYFHINPFKQLELEDIDINSSWSYLENNEWKKFDDKNIIFNSTINFMKSGIIFFDFDSKINVSKNTILPSGILWFRLKGDFGSAFLDSIEDIRTQVVVAQFENHNNNLTHLINGLPPGSITSMMNPDSGVETIEQPYFSQGGEIPEDESYFSMRVSERLNHKDRMITQVDFERLILDTYPEVFRVKCLINTNKMLDVSPGKALILIIPVISDDNSTKTHYPRIPLYRLEEIRNFVKSKTSGLAEIDVINPNYEEIQVKFNVKFHKGIDSRLYIGKLNEELKAFFSPWIYKDSEQLDVTESLTGSSILYFLETRGYIDIVVNFSVNHIVGENVYNYSSNNNEEIEIKPSTPVSIFTSAPYHIINLLDEENMTEYGINEMVIENDLIVEGEYFSHTKNENGIEKMAVNVDFELDFEESPPEKKDNYVIRLK